ncbi:MAG TPA: Nramp family divalent metal transporter [Methanocorpusculum sp.]|nr:Nramp family divalent metal transporter [Methanocorpusculum sp.]
MPKKTSGIYKKIKDNLIFFGPGLLLAVTAAGEAGIADAMEIGAHHGLTLAWVVIICLLFKYAYTVGIARYTLATGKSIFEAMTSIPGPKNWAAYFTIAAYLFEATAIGSMAVFAAVFIDYLLPGMYALFLLGMLILLVALVVLRTHIYHQFEKIMAVIVAVLGVVLIYLMIMAPSISSGIIEGMIPAIPDGAEKEILGILGVVGSGLTLMLYSVWLKHKIQSRGTTENDAKTALKEKKEMFRRYLKSVRIDIVVGFVLVAVIILGFMTLGSLAFTISYQAHGTTISIDLLTNMVMNVFINTPIIYYILLIFFIIIFFGAITVGLDARASAITDVIKQIRLDAGKPVKNSSLVYNICLLLFVLLSAIIIYINEPLETMMFMAVICAILFGIFGFMMMYLNTKLPVYARGSRMWMLLIGIGSVLSIYIALRLEGTIITSGLDMVRNLALVLVVLFLFIRSKMFDRIAKGTGNLADKFWMIVILSVVSIWGTIGGIAINDGAYILNFRDLGAIVAGVAGGPVVGAIVGIIGGFYRLTLGGASAWPCFLATIAAGIIAGLFIRMWNGKFTVFRGLALAVVVECFHLLFIFPTFQMTLGTMTAPEVVDAIRSMILAMTAVVGSGTICFGLFVHKVECFAGALQKFSWKKLLDDLHHLTKKDGEDEDDDDEESAKDNTQHTETHTESKPTLPEDKP